MRVEHKITKEVTEDKDNLCNKCGKTTIPELCRKQHRAQFYGLINAHFSTGYCSPTLPDMMEYEFSLCEPCVAELMETFTIPCGTEVTEL